MLANRPVNPQDIKFSSDCFEILGEEVYYTVGTQRINRTAEYTKLEEAEKFAKSCGQAVTKHKRDIRRRIKWF